MRSIRKIVSTPVKWASREVLHRTLLKFPGGNADDPVACAYCPEMCRFTCPTAVASGNDAVTPMNKMGLLHARREWPAVADRLGEPWPVYDCTGCGRCTEYCVYSVSVADQLFEARTRTAPWTRAREVGAHLSDRDDPWGDLSAELGLSEISAKRTSAFAEREHGRVAEVAEPKAVFHLGMAGVSVALAWQSLLLMGADEGDPGWTTLRSLLCGRRWVVYESVWLSRRLGRHAQVARFAEQARAQGILLELAGARQADVEDAGGEGAYAMLFAENARRIASEWWERARSRNGADGILSMSPRGARFFREVLPPDVEIVDMASLYGLLLKGREG